MSLIKDALDKALETERDEEPTAKDRYKNLDSRADSFSSGKTEAESSSKLPDDSPDTPESSNWSMLFLIMGVLGFVLVAQILILWFYVL